MPGLRCAIHQYPLHPIYVMCTCLWKPCAEHALQPVQFLKLHTRVNVSGRSVSAMSHSQIADQGYSTRGVTCWSGNDDEAHAARHQFGAGGVISVTSNLIPGLFSTLMAVRDDQQMDRCDSCHNRH